MVEALESCFEDMYYPRSVEEVRDIIGKVSQDDCNIVPMGNGTKVGEYIGNHVQRTIGLSMKKLNKVLEINQANLTITVEAGISLFELQKVLLQHNLWLPVVVQRAELRTIGGLIAENAKNYEKYSGKNIGDYVIGLEFVTPEGEMIRTGGRTVKNVAGYDFTHLLNSSIGTLAIITKVTFKLKPKAELRKTVLIAAADLSTGNDLLTIVKKMSLTTTSFHLFTITSDFDPAFFERAEAIGVISLEGVKATVEDHISKIQEGVRQNGVVEKVLNSTDYWENYSSQYSNIPQKYKICGKVDKRHLPNFIDLTCESKKIFAGFFIDIGTGDISMYCRDEEVFKDMHDRLEEFTTRYALPSWMVKKRSHPLYRLIKNSLDKKNCLFANNLVLSINDSVTRK